MFQEPTKTSYYVNIGICATFGLVYFIVGIVNLVWGTHLLGLVFFGVGSLILIFSAIAFFGKRFGVILLIIIHIGNPITMISAFQALKYLNECGDDEVDLINKKQEKRKANYFYQKKMEKKYKNEPKLD